MKGERLLKAFFEAGQSRFIEEFELRHQAVQCGPGFLIGGFFIGLLQSSAPGCLLVFGKIAHHIFSFVPLTSLDERSVRENLSDRRIKPFGTVDNAKDAFLYVQTPTQQPT